MTAAVAAPPPAATLAPAHELALALHALLTRLDAAFEAGLHGEAAALRERAAATRDRTEDAHGELRAALDRVYGALGEVPQADLTPARARRAWRRLRQRLLDAYAGLSASLAAWDIHVPALRPTNYARNAFHVANAAAAATVLSLWPDRTLLLVIIGAVFTWAWTMETLRRRWGWLNDRLMDLLGTVAHPHEWRRINSATWYTSALFLLTVLGWLTASLPALVVLGLGDPAAAIVGRRWGRTPLIHGRSLEGTLAFVVCGGLPAAALMAVVHPELSAGLVATTAGAAAVAGAIAELVSRRIDDNFTIPVAAASAAAVVLASAGITP